MKLSSDCFPFLLLSDKSVVELNRRLEESESDVRVSDLWFRPNISVKDVSAPFVEDEWTYVKGPFTCMKSVRGGEEGCPNHIMHTAFAQYRPKGQNGFEYISGNKSVPLGER